MASFEFANGYRATEVDGDTVTVGTVVNNGSNPWTIVDTNGGELELNDLVTIGSQTYAYRGFEGTGTVVLEIWDTEFNEPTGVLRVFTNDPEVTTGDTVNFTAETFPYCLLQGTRVLTPTGERPVEDLRIGDLVLTADGEAVTVRWVGRQSLITMFNGRALPIVIRAGALADNVPSRDLHVSPDHAILIDDYLVHAQALVNGTTITVMDNPPAQLDYYHLELDTQRIIIADGTPVESFVDDSTRAGFDNYHEWVALGLKPQPADTLPHPRVKTPDKFPRRSAHAYAKGSWPTSDPAATGRPRQHPGTR
jgi:hypothetical protein